MEWELILIELLVAILIVVVCGFCLVGLVWVWLVMNEDMVKRFRDVGRSRRKWRSRK